MIFLMVLFLIACTPEGTVDYEAIFLAAQAEVELAPTVNDDIILPTSVEVEGKVVTITWVSSHPNIISITGDVTRPNSITGNLTVTLTATFKLNNEKHDHDFMIVVEALETVTFTVNFYDGDDLVDTKLVAQGNKVTAPTTMSPEPGYVFGGWYKDNELKETWDFNNDLVNENINLYADWDLITYNIMYHNLEGATHTNPMFFNITTANHLLTEATKTGFEFIGWFTALEGGVQVTTLTFDEPINLNLYARFESLSYTITYLNMDGIAHSNPNSYSIMSDDILLSEPNEKPNYEFQGWFSDEAMTTLISVITKGSTGNLTLYAKWVPVQYTITYHLDGGIIDGDIVESYTILTPTFNLPEVTKEGYAFMGWFNDEEAGLEITNILTGTTGNVTLYARFSPYITVYYYGQTTTKAAMIQTNFDNSIILTTDGQVLTEGRGDYGLIGNGSFQDQFEFVNITSMFDLNADEVVTQIDLYDLMALARTNQNRVFIWGYLSDVNDDLYINQPLDLTIQFDFEASEEVLDVASFGTFFLVYTNQGVYHFENEEAKTLNAPVNHSDFKWGSIFGFGTFDTSLSYRLGNEIYLFDTYLAKDFVNITTILNLPEQENIQIVLSQDDAVHVLMENSYHFAQFQNSEGMPLVMYVPLNLTLNLDETLLRAFAGGALLTSESRLLIPVYDFDEDTEMPLSVSYIDVTDMLELNPDETIVDLFNPMFILTSEGRFLLIGSEETEEGNQMMIHEIDLGELLKQNELLLEVSYDFNSLLFRTNFGLYEVTFGQMGLELDIIEVRTSGIVYEETQIMAIYDPSGHNPESPLYQAFEGWYMDEDLTQPWNPDLTIDKMILYPKFIPTHYEVVLVLYSGLEEIYVPLETIPEIDEPTWPHMEFNGWFYYNENDEYVEYVFDQPLKSGTQLFAQFTPHFYEVTVHLNETESYEIDVMAYTMLYGIDFSMSGEYEITGLFVDIERTIEVDMDAEVLSDLTLYATYVAKTVDIYYYLSLDGVEIEQIFASGNQIFGITTSGEFVGIGSNFDGALGIGMEDVGGLDFAIDLAPFFNLEIDEVVVNIYQNGSKKVLLTSNNRIFSWGYYYIYENNYKTAYLAIDLTEQLNLTPIQTINDIFVANYGFYVFLDEGVVVYYDYQTGHVTDMLTGISFGSIFNVTQHYNENYEYQGEFSVFSSSGVYHIMSQRDQELTVNINFDDVLLGDELIFIEQNFQAFESYYVYSKEGRRYQYDYLTMSMIFNYDLMLNENEYLTEVYNVAWNARAMMTTDQRLLVYETQVHEVSLVSLNPGEHIVGFMYSSDFVTNLGRFGYLNIGSKTISLNDVVLELNEQEITSIQIVNWEPVYRLSNGRLLNSNGESFILYMGTDLEVESYVIGEEFVPRVPDPMEDYSFAYWSLYNDVEAYQNTPESTTFLFANWIALS